MPKISVILPVYNEEKYIERCLESVCKQSLKPDEIIVVDDGSTDASASVISNFQSIRHAQDKFSIFNFQFIRQKHQGPAAARNFGAKMAKGEFLVFLDADMVYERDYINELVKPIINGKEIATFTSNEFVGNMDNKWAKYWDDLSYGNSGKRSIAGQPKRTTAFRAIQTSEFHKAGGFESSGYTDDGLMLQKIGKKAKCVDSAVCYHFNPSSLREVFYSARWIGRDSKNRGKIMLFWVFSPVWSFFKAIRGMVNCRDFHFFFFRVVFDFGYFIGLVDYKTKHIHYK